MQLTDLARLAHIDSGNLSRIESGETPNPRANTVVKLARALGVSTDYLLGANSLTQQTNKDVAFIAEVLSLMDAEGVELAKNIVLTLKQRAARIDKERK